MAAVLRRRTQGLWGGGWNPRQVGTAAGGVAVRRRWWRRGNQSKSQVPFPPKAGEEVGGSEVFIWNKGGMGAWAQARERARWWRWELAGHMRTGTPPTSALNARGA